MSRGRYPLMLALGLLLGTRAGAQNLLVNPNFDTGTTGWNTFQGMVFDPTRDSTGNPNSGSGQQASTGAFGNHTTQCLNIIPGVPLAHRVAALPRRQRDQHRSRDGRDLHGFL